MRRRNVMLSDNIRNYRKANNMSQDELAERLGISRQSVSLWENGQTQPTIENVIALAKIFNISADVLINDSDEKPSQAEKAEKAPSRTNYKTGIIIGIIVAAIIVLAIALFAIFSNGDTNNQNPPYNPSIEQNENASEPDDDKVVASDEIAENKEDAVTEHDKDATVNSGEEIGNESGDEIGNESGEKTDTSNNEVQEQTPTQQQPVQQEPVQQQPVKQEPVQQQPVQQEPVQQQPVKQEPVQQQPVQQPPVQQEPVQQQPVQQQPVQQEPVQQQPVQQQPVQQQPVQQEPVQQQPVQQEPVQQPEPVEEFDLYTYCKNFAINYGYLNGDYSMYQQVSSRYGGRADEYFSISYWSSYDKVEFCLHCPLSETFSVNFYLTMRGGFDGKYEFLSSRYYRDTGESYREVSGIINPALFSNKYPLPMEDYFGPNDGMDSFLEESRIGICDLIACIKEFVRVEGLECDFSEFGFVNF